MGTGGGVLIKDEILAEIANGNLVLGGIASQARGCSYDLTVGTMFWENKIHKGQGAQVVVPPGGLIAILTAEELLLPLDICATAFAINAMSSKGFLVLNPGHIDPDFRGALTVKALNIRKVPIPILFGDPIFTVIFQRLPAETSRYKGTIYSQPDRERTFNATTIETSPRTIFEMMPTDRNGPYPARDEVNEMIRRHWLGWLTLGLSVLTLIAAGVAAWKSVYPTPVSNPPPSVTPSEDLKSSQPLATAPALTTTAPASAPISAPAPVPASAGKPGSATPQKPTP